MSINQLINEDDKPWLNIKCNSIDTTSKSSFLNIETNQLFLSEDEITTSNIQEGFGINYINSASPLSLTLPQPNTARSVIIVNKGAGTVTIDSSQLSGSLTYTIPTNESVTVLVSDSGRYILSQSGNVSSA